MKRFYMFVQVTVLSMAMTGLAAAAQVRAESRFSEQADALVKYYVQGELFTGTVLVARDGKPIFRKAYGAANRE